MDISIPISILISFSQHTDIFIIALRFKENFSFAEKFSYLSSVSTRQEISSHRFLRLIERKYLKGKSVPATKVFQPEG